MDTFEQLATEYFDGALAPGQTDELIRILEGDRERYTEFLDMYRNERVLIAELREVEAEAFAQRVLAELAADESRMVESVMQEVERYPRQPTIVKRRRRQLWVGPSRAEREGPAARLRRRRAGVRVLRRAVAAAVLIAAGSLFYANRLRTVREAPVARVMSPAEAVVCRGQERVAARDGLALQQRDGLEVGALGAAVVAYSDGTRLALAADTAIRVERRDDELGLGTIERAWQIVQGLPPGAKRIEVARGRLGLDVPAQPKGCPLRVTTPHIEAVVIGTRFDVAVNGAVTRVEVALGEVRVLNRQTRESVALLAGYRGEFGARSVVAASPRVDRAPPPTGPLPAGPGLQALYTFMEGRGTVVRDVSQIGTALDLYVRDPAMVDWLPGGGLALRRPTLLASRGAADKLIRACRLSNEISVELWLKPLLAMQTGPARIVSCAQDVHFANFMVGMDPGVQGEGYGYVARLMTTAPERDARYDALCTPGIAQAGLTHLVFTRDRAGNARLYLNGADRTAGLVQYSKTRAFVPGTPVFGGDFSNWAAGLPLLVGGELDEPRPWLGDLYRLAIYNRALPLAEVQAQYRAGHRAPATARR